MTQKKLQLQPRLERIASSVPDGARLADVGTDHGYIPVWLLQHGLIESAIASDIGREPLEHARRTAAEYGVKEKLSFRLCAGLAGIAPEECDTVVIAGMGAETIMEILSAAPWTKDGAHRLILQPQTKIEEFRQWLAAQGYRAEREQLVRDKGKLYVVLSVTGGKIAECSAETAYAGFALENDPLYGDYLDAQIARLTRRAQGLAATSGRNDERTAYLTLIEKLEERKGKWVNEHSI